MVRATDEAKHNHTLMLYFLCVILLICALLSNVNHCAWYLQVAASIFESGASHSCDRPDRWSLERLLQGYPPRIVRSITIYAVVDRTV